MADTKQKNGLILMTLEFLSEVDDISPSFQFEIQNTASIALIRKLYKETLQWVDTPVLDPMSKDHFLCPSNRRTVADTA
eukprot:10195823-Ditylum_brightwellii.AAC.1